MDPGKYIKPMRCAAVAIETDKDWVKPYKFGDFYSLDIAVKQPEQTESNNLAFVVPGEHTSGCRQKQVKPQKIRNLHYLG